ncbi:Esa1p-associated factor [Dimargaris verticillata]|uniref:Chromatin modification-related protein EAF3 n=1 Tax=Dimargaris verticillata TaxID=2761393 RepID=A0A9W8B7H2_9FUNG|nr:Esa1p-associated factor [Dimargaris verticillata]
MGKPDSLTFADNERVLCFHGPLMYEAKVLKAEHWTGEAEDEDEEGPHYLIHYKGWKQTWDEWVPESRVQKYSPENLERQRQLKERYAVKKKSTSASSVSRDKSSQQGSHTTSPTDRSRKRPRDVLTDKDDDYIKRPEIRIPIPNALKSLLVDDWEHITKDQQLVPLPRNPSVADILGQYKRSKLASQTKKKRGHDRYHEDILDEVLEGLRLYFDKALGNILLYRFERLQYADMCKQHPNRPMSDIYGAEHLLRLFVQLPSLIAHTHMEPDAISILKEHLSDFLMFLQKDTKAFFTTEYENASPAYLSVSRH